MSISKAKIIAKQYAELLKKNKIKFETIYLYGSQSTGKANKHSDIDLAIIVKKIGSPSQYTGKKMLLWQLAPNVDARIEPIILEERELKNGSSTLGEQVKKYGIPINA